MLIYLSCGVLGFTWGIVLWMIKKLHDSQKEEVVYWDDMTDEEKREYLDDEIDEYMSNHPKRVSKKED